MQSALLADQVTDLTDVEAAGEAGGSVSVVVDKGTLDAIGLSGHAGARLSPLFFHVEVLLVLEESVLSVVLMVLPSGSLFCSLADGSSDPTLNFLVTMT